MTNEQIVEIYERQLEELREVLEEEKAAAVSLLEDELDKARKERYDLQMRLNHITNGFVDAQQSSKAIIETLQAGQAMLVIQKANQENEVVRGAWRNYMLALKMAGYDGTNNE